MPSGLLDMTPSLTMDESSGYTAPGEGLQSPHHIFSMVDIISAPFAGDWLRTQSTSPLRAPCLW